MATRDTSGKRIDITIEAVVIIDGSLTATISAPFEAMSIGEEDVLSRKFDLRHLVGERQRRYVYSGSARDAPQ